MITQIDKRGVTVRNVSKFIHFKGHMKRNKKNAVL